MSKSCCNNKSLLSRDGTSQQQRILKALLPGYVAVDERNIEDLKKFAVNYAKEIRFYNKNNEEDGNWENFFENKTIDEKNKLTDPHYALFYTFLKLFKYAQDDLNKITKKHIDFFYRDVLQLKERKAVSDQTFIIFELAKHVSSFMIKKGTKLKAGKDSLGKELIYEVDKDIVVNKAQIKELKSLYIHKEEDTSSKKSPKLSLYASPVANSSDGEGPVFDTDDLSWRTFGDTDPINPDRKLANIGFAFASPILHLSEGDRIVTITLKVGGGGSRKTRKILNMLKSIPEIDKVFRILFSGEEKWLESIYDESHITEEQLPGCIEQEILNFVNSAQVPEDISGKEPWTDPIIDDPTKGYGDQIKDYDIGKTTAKKIIEYRNNLDIKKYTIAKQLLNVEGFGKDKMDDMIYSFKRNYHFTKIEPDKGQIIIRRTLDRIQEPVVAYNKENLLEPFDTKNPVAKVLLNTKYPDIYSEVYANLAKLNLLNAKINVLVVDMTSLILQNDNSILDPSKPVIPFTNQPIKGSTFYIGNWEVFQKKPDFAHLKYTWVDLPQNPTGFKNYYKHYYDIEKTEVDTKSSNTSILVKDPDTNDGSTDLLNRSNQDFTIKISYLEDKKWKEIKSKTFLFTDDMGNSVEDEVQLPDNDDMVLLDLIEADQKLEIKRSTEVEEFDKYDNSVIRGFMKLELSGMDFGHKAFHLSYTKALLGEITHGVGITIVPDNIPKEPYTPTISNIKLDYSSTVELSIKDLINKEKETVIDQFFLIHPFGIEEIKNKSQNGSLIAEKSEGTKNKKPELKQPLVPAYTDEGYLFIGFEDLVVPQSVSLLFKISEKSAKTFITESPIIKYEYLEDNTWEEFTDKQKLGNTTDDLTLSGLINLSVPKFAKRDNTILASGLHWIRISCSANSDSVPDLVSIKTQAVTASFKDEGNDPNHLALALAKETISKLKVSESSIKSLSQPYESYGGKTMEQSNNFYKRTSERLRHKNRAISLWDYERLILEEFNTIYKVKCLNHTVIKPKFYNAISPGNTSIVVVPGVKNRTEINLLAPKANQGTLVQIKNFIKKLNSPSSTIHVVNPVYEEIKMSFQVSFLIDEFNYYKALLNEDLKKFLAPWAYNSDSDVIFGGKIHKSVILNFVEELVYVDYVQSFKMENLTNSLLKGKDLDEAVASTSASILTSVSEHLIEAIGEESKGNIIDSRKYGEIKDCIER